MGYINAHSARLIVESAIRDGLSESKATSLASLFLHSQNPTAADLGVSITSNRTILAGAHYAFETGAANAARLVYYTTVAFGAVVIICTLFIEDLGKFLDNRVLAVVGETAGEQQKSVSNEA